MKELYLSDLHIGLEPDGRLESLTSWLERHPINRIIVHGDALHLDEVPLGEIMKTRDWAALDNIARETSVEIIPGNHDGDLKKLIGQKIGNCEVIAGYLDMWGYWHSHWCEYDPIFNLLHWWEKIGAKLFGKTPYELLQPKVGNPAYLIACQVIYTNIIDGRKHKGYIGGHTHMPMYWTMPDLPLELWNCGDMVDSMSGILRVDDQLELVFFNH